MKAKGELKMADDEWEEVLLFFYIFKGSVNNNDDNVINQKNILKREKSVKFGNNYSKVLFIRLIYDL